MASVAILSGSTLVNIGWKIDITTPIIVVPIAAAAVHRPAGPPARAEKALHARTSIVKVTTMIIGLWK